MSGLESSREIQQVNSSENVSRVIPAKTKSSADISVLLKNAILLARNHEYQLAMNLLRTALAQKPNDRVALKWLGYCFKETGKLAEAIRCFTAFNEQIADSDVLYFV